MKLFSTLPPSLVWVLDKGRKEVLSDGTVSTYFKGKVPIRMFQEMEKFFKSENAFQRDLRTNEVNYSLSRDEHSISMTLNRKSRTVTITFNNYEALFGKVASAFQEEINTMSLRKKIIRLAYQNPELREDLLPLLKESFSKLSFRNLEEITDDIKKDGLIVGPRFKRLRNQAIKGDVEGFKETVSEHFKKFLSNPKDKSWAEGIIKEIHGSADKVVENRKDKNQKSKGRTEDREKLLKKMVPNPDRGKPRQRDEIQLGTLLGKDPQKAKQYLKKGTTKSLRKKIIRLAYQNPELRGDLLPLLKESSNFDPQEIGKLKKKKHIDKDDDYLSDEFTQQEFSELRKKQQSGKLASSLTSFAAFREKMKIKVDLHPGSSEDYFAVGLRVNGKKVGQATVYSTLRYKNCKKNVAEIEQSLEYRAAKKKQEVTSRFGWNPKMYVVDNAWISEEADRGKGYGKLIYQAVIDQAVKYAKKDGGVFIGSSACDSGGVSATSIDAGRVWKSLGKHFATKSGQLIFVRTN